MHFLFRLTQKQRRGKESVLDVPTSYSLQQEAWVDMPQIARLVWRKGDPHPPTRALGSSILVLSLNSFFSH